MKVGDLVRFRKCRQEGKFGVMIRIPKQSPVSKNQPALWVYHIRGVAD